MKRKIISCLLIVGLVHLSIPAWSQEAIYKDVSPGHWANEAIYELSKRGVIKGYLERGERLYKGNKPLTRYEFAVALEKLIQNLEEAMVVLDSERAKKVDYVDAAVQKSARRNERALADIKSDLNAVESKSKKVTSEVARLEDRLMAIESKPIEKPLPKWLVIGTTVVAITALVIAAEK